MKSNIKITSKLIKKFLAGDRIEIYNEEGIQLLHEENGTLRDIVYAEIIRGHFEKSISIYLEKEAYEKDKENFSEMYYTEEIYKLPYSKNKKWIKSSLKNAQEQWCTSYMNG